MISKGCNMKLKTPKDGLNYEVTVKRTGIEDDKYEKSGDSILDLEKNKGIIIGILAFMWGIGLISYAYYKDFKKNR